MKIVINVFVLTVEKLPKIKNKIMKIKMKIKIKIISNTRNAAENKNLISEWNKVKYSKINQK